MKKILMTLAIAACAASAQAAKVQDYPTYPTDYVTDGIGYEIREGPKGPITGNKDQVKYISVYSMSADKLAAQMKVDDSKTLTVELVGSWLNKSFADNSSWFKDNTFIEWKVNDTAQQRLTIAHTESPDVLALIARTDEKVKGVSVADNEWVLALYHDGDSDCFRVAHAITGGATDKVKDDSNALRLPTDSFVVFNGKDGNTKSEWGKWTAANVPEPTGGLLMLLGLAGLALKRKRA